MAIPLFFVGIAGRAASIAAVRVAGASGATGVALRHLLRNLPNAALGLAGEARFEWHGDEFSKALISVMQQRLNRASKHMYDHIYWKISVVTNQREDGTVERSKPGQYPRMDTGRLRSDFFREFDRELSVIMGTRIWYGMKLEMSMRRSWLRRGFRESWPKSRDILLHGPPPIRDSDLLGPLGASSRSNIKGLRARAKSTIRKARNSVKRARAKATKSVLKGARKSAYKAARARAKAAAKRLRTKQKAIKKVLTKTQRRRNLAAAKRLRLKQKAIKTVLTKTQRRRNRRNP